MHSLTYKYENDELLKKWIIDNNLFEVDNCLVQFFSGIAKEETMQHISNILGELLSKAHIIGSTTDGEIYFDEVTLNEIIISVSIFEHSTLESTWIEYETDSYDMGVSLASKLEAEDTKVLITFSTGLHINGEDFVDGIYDVSQGRYIVSGGMAGDNAKFKKTFVVYNTKVLSKGAVGVVIKSKVLKVNNNYRFGWDAVGLPMKVTKSVGNRVYEIENTPVMSIYKKYFGKKISNLLPEIGIEIPLIVKRNDENIARACINVYDDGSLLFAGSILEGEDVRFGIGHSDIISKHSSTMHKEVMMSFCPESIFVYSCMARRRLLGSKNSFELTSMSKQCSVSGFFTYGEFFSDEKSNYLFNETITILSLSEAKEENQIDEFVLEPFKNPSEEENAMVFAMTHMTNVIAQEWQERLNQEIDKNKEQERQNFQRNKLAQMGEMIGMIAHQWRQPLNAISATGINLSLLSSMGMLEDKKVVESSEFIQEQCQIMSSTIDTFMNFVKPAKESKSFSLKHTVDAIMQIMGTQLSNHNIKVEIDSEDDSLTMDGYEDLLEQVIINILSNARDAFEELEKDEKKIKIKIYKEKDIPIITIEDNAGGIPKG
ncbi:MAG: FIST N-terminal domain-containing protein, partial [Campylobacterales bacterium]